MAKASAREQVVLELPDLGLSKAQLASLKKSFKAELVSSMPQKTAATRIVVVIIRIRRAQFEA